jgi:ACS family glucarate transporter-like MFS transporter
MSERRRILILLFLISVVTYLDRVNISIASPFILSEFGLDKVQMGVVFSAFVAGYMLFQIPGGWLGDRFGHKRSLTFSLIWWSVFTAMTAWAGSTHLISMQWLLPAFWVARFLVGVGEAGAYPCANGIIGRSFRTDERALAAGVMFAGIGVGSALAPPFIAWIVLHWGWRWAFYISAGIGIALALGFHFGMPETSGDDTISESSSTTVVKTPWKEILSSRQIWMLASSIFFFGYVTYVFFFWFYPYLVQVRKISLLRSSFFTALPFMTMAVSAPLGGRLSDILVPRIGSTLARRRVAMAGLLAAAFFIPCGAIIPNSYVAIACLSLGAGSVYLAISSYFATAVEIFPLHAATVSGTMNTGAGLGGIVAPILTPWLAEHFGWVAAIGSAGVFSFIAAILWLFIGAGERLKVEEAS